MLCPLEAKCPCRKSVGTGHALCLVAWLLVSEVLSQELAEHQRRDCLQASGSLQQGEGVPAAKASARDTWKHGHMGAKEIILVFSFCLILSQFYVAFCYSPILLVEKLTFYQV